MKVIYPALFHEEENAYWVEFPDLEGCNSFGETKEEVLANAQEAMEGYILAVLEDAHKLPVPSDIRDIKCDENSFASYVSSDLSVYLKSTRAVKKTLTIPGWLNAVAEKNEVNFSAVLAEALMRQLNIVS